VVENADPLANHAAGMLVRLEPMSMYALPGGKSSVCLTGMVCESGSLTAADIHHWIRHQHR
jgi:hypothetical protein